MSDAESPALELVAAIKAKLQADSKVAALVENRIWDQPLPVKERVYPNITFGRVSEDPDDANCIDAARFTIQLDGWTRGNGGRGEVGFPQAYRLSSRVRNALHEQPLTLTDNAFLLMRHIGSDTFRDSDGLTSHSVMIFEAYVELR